MMAGETKTSLPAPSTLFVQLYNVKQYDSCDDDDSDGDDSDGDDSDAGGGGNGDSTNDASTNDASTNGNEEAKTAPSTRRTEYYGFYPKVRKLKSNHWSISKTKIYDVNTGMWHDFGYFCSGCFLFGLFLGADLLSSLPPPVQ